jgi:hypothetical protein
MPHNLLFMYLQIQKAKEDADIQIYAEGDIVQVMGYGLEEEEKVVAHGKVKNVEGGSLYMLFKSIDLDHPFMTMIGEAVGNFILWSTEFLRHSSVAE